MSRAKYERCICAYEWVMTHICSRVDCVVSHRYPANFSLHTTHTHAHTHTPPHAHAHIHPRRRASVVSHICVNMNELCHTCVKQLSHDSRKSSKLNSASPCERLVNTTCHTYVYQGNVRSHIMSHTCEAAEWWHTNIHQSDSLMSGVTNMFISSSCVTRHVIVAHILSFSGAAQSWHNKIPANLTLHCHGSDSGSARKDQADDKKQSHGGGGEGGQFVNQDTRGTFTYYYTEGDQCKRAPPPPPPIKIGNVTVMSPGKLSEGQFCLITLSRQDPERLWHLSHREFLELY